MKLLRYLHRGLAVTVFTAVMALALQAQTTFILLGTYQGVTYEAQVMPSQDVAKTRNVFLEGKNQGYSLITDWKYDCAGKKVTKKHIYIYDPDSVLVQEAPIEEPWLDVNKDSFLGHAMSDYWCKNVD